MIELTPRLRAAAELADGAGCVADIGTDHGRIPVYLAQRGLASRIIAADIRPGPLSGARRTAVRYGVADRIEFMLTDGLAGMEGFGLDAAVLAGMGSETIEAILAASGWARAQGVRLILQPQTKLAGLSCWLGGNGYAVFDETLVKDGGRIYAVLLAGAGEGRAPLSPAECCVDRLLLEKRDPLLPEYLDTLISRFSRRIAGMESARRALRGDELAGARSALDGFLKMREETEKWRL